MGRRDRKKAVDGVVKEDQQALGNWKHNAIINAMMAIREVGS